MWDEGSLPLSLCWTVSLPPKEPKMCIVLSNDLPSSNHEKLEIKINDQPLVAHYKKQFHSSSYLAKTCTLHQAVYGQITQ